MISVSLPLLKRLSWALTLVAVGYILGQVETLRLHETQAQGPEVVNKEENAIIQVTLSNDAVRQIQTANEALATAMETLRLEGQYTPATDGVNPYLIMTGGGNAIEDLELGTGVDPVTFAGLYAGQAIREVEDELSRDESNRLLYKNNLVRIYSMEKLQKRLEMREAILEKRVLPQ